MQSWSGYFSLWEANRMLHWKEKKNHFAPGVACIYTATDTNSEAWGPEDKERNDWGKELFIKPKDREEKRKDNSPSFPLGQMPSREEESWAERRRSKYHPDWEREKGVGDWGRWNKRYERGRVHCSTTQTQRKKNTPSERARLQKSFHTIQLNSVSYAAAASKQIQTERKSAVLWQSVAFSTAEAA